MLKGEGKVGEEPSIIFQKTIKELLNLKISLSNIYPIYDYFDEAAKKNNFVFYVEVNKSPQFKYPSQGSSLNWLTFAETSKLPFFNHCKQDVIVGERVINLKSRLEQESIAQSL